MSMHFHSSQFTASFYIPQDVLCIKSYVLLTLLLTTTAQMLTVALRLSIAAVLTKKHFDEIAPAIPQNKIDKFSASRLGNV